MAEKTINVSTVIQSGLGLEAYFILYCLYLQDEQLISSYTSKCKKINTEIFLELEQAGFIKINRTHDKKIYYRYLSLTEKGKSLLIAKIDSSPCDGGIPSEEHNFEEFRTYYPSFVKNGFKTRRLHGNLKKCRTLYDKLLMETTHNILCKCAQLYYNELADSGSEFYMQNLETWLNQKNYLQYVEDAKQLKETTNITTNNDQGQDI